SMGSKVISRAKTFYNLLRSLQDGEEGSNPCNVILEEDIQILKMKGDQIPVINMHCANQPVHVCEKAVPKLCEDGDQKLTETSACSDENDNHSGVEAGGEIERQTALEPQPLTVMKARQLLSWYTLSHNANVSAMENNPALLPLWVRCDMSDPAGTTWLGAETICISHKVSGVKLYSITCKGITTITYNYYRLICTNVFLWLHICFPLQRSLVLNNIKVRNGDMKSPMFEMYRELEFLQTLADGLRTGETEWVEPLDSTSPADLTKVFLSEVQSITKTLQEQVSRPVQTTKPKSETDPPIFKSLLERGDLDFVEQLWVLLRKSVTSYQDIGNCLKLVIDALRFGDIKPWLMAALLPHALVAFVPDSQRQQQEQVIRLQKLHHVLEVVLTCSTFLGLPYDRLFLLTQSCLQHYKTEPYNEEHEFKLQIKPALISHFYQKEHPVMWGVEVSSGHGPREVRTCLHFSDRPLVDHVFLDLPNETVNGEDEEPAFFSTMVCCSLVNFA
uniref:Protein zwilch n=2 Tax=Tetraodon nigroviridis TaxID=99883 RepID=H3CSN0_TETNG